MSLQDSSNTLPGILPEILLGEEEALKLLEDGASFLDVRAELEFEHGHVPGAMNLPLLKNQERTIIGTTYKQEGSERAVQRGHEIVSGYTKQERVAQWKALVDEGKVQALYCARGGLRSKITQSWIAEQGSSIPRVAGGYKSLRRLCLRVIETHVPKLSWIGLSGKTGAGKTELLQKLAPYVSTIDLEALANHRGSVFGACDVKQPSQATFENALAQKIMRIPAGSQVLIECESRRIGDISIPEPLYSCMKTMPRIELQASTDARIERILREYITEAKLSNEDILKQKTHFIFCIERISSHLGGLRCSEVKQLLEDAYTKYARNHDIQEHRAWVQYLLENYYDPMYEFAAKKQPN